MDAGAGIRIISGESTAYGFTNDLSFEGILAVAEVVAKACLMGKKDIILDLRKLEPRVTFPVEKRPDQVPVDDKVSLVMKANEAARKLDHRIRQTVGYGDRSGSFHRQQRRPFRGRPRIRTRLAINAVAVEKILSRPATICRRQRGYELFQRSIQ